MNHTEAKELLFVDRYLSGELSAAEREAFEAHILACQQCLDELELTEKLRLGFKDAFGGNPAAPEQTASGDAVASLRTMRYATAASVLLAASLLTAGLMYRHSDRGEGPAAAQVFPILATRSISAESGNLLRLSSPEAVAVLLVDPGPTDYADYRVRVQRDDAADRPVVTELSGLHPTYEDMLAVSIPSSALPSGDYVIELSGRAGQDAGYEPITRLGFRVVD